MALFHRESASDGAMVRAMDFFDKAWPFTESSDGVFTQKAAADKNKVRILGLIARRRCVSQRQLALATGLQPSTVSNIVRLLKGQGIVRDGSAIEAERVGPKETELDLVPECLWCAGVTLDPVGHRLVLVNACGHILAQESLPPGLAAADIVPRIVESVRVCAARANLDLARLAGLGVSVPGAVDSERGVILISRALGLSQFELRAPLEAALGCPVWVERNVTCGAYAEHHTGVARGKASFIYFLLRTDSEHPLSFGLALVIGEKIFHGCNSAAGEVDRNLLSVAFSANPVFRDPPDATVETFYKALAHALTGIVNLLDIGCVVFSSNDERLTDDRFTRLRDSIAAGLIPVPDRRFDLLRSGMGVDGMMLGGALLALHRSLAAQLGHSKKAASPRGKRLEPR